MGGEESRAHGDGVPHWERLVGWEHQNGRPALPLLPPGQLAATVRTCFLGHHGEVPLSPVSVTLNWFSGMCEPTFMEGNITSQETAKWRALDNQRKLKRNSCLAGVAQWIECWPANENVAG